VVELAGADGRRQRGLVGEPERRQPPAVGIGLLRPERQLALHHGEHVGGDPRVELQPALGGRHDVALEPLAHGLHHLLDGRDVVRARHGSTSRRSYSFSHTRRPMAASSCERDAPERCTSACMMQ
jgi:hypothetical protein